MFNATEEIEGLTRLEVLLKIADADTITGIDQIIFSYILGQIRPDALVKNGLVYYPNSKPISIQDAAGELLDLIEGLLDKNNI